MFKVRVVSKPSNRDTRPRRNSNCLFLTNDKPLNSNIKTTTTTHTHTK